MSIEEQFKINLNQNLWGLIIGFTALGLSEYYKLCALFWFSIIGSGIMLLSVAITTYAYTQNYCKNKTKQ